MRFLRLFLVFSIMFVFVMTVMAQTREGQAGVPPARAGQGGPTPQPFIMTITGFADGSDIPAKYTQAGDQTSPAIGWTNAPAGTVTFVLHMHDMEGSHNHTTDDQIHWLVWNIPGTATGLPEGIPKGAQLQNGAYQISASGPVYRGPGAPPMAPGTITPSNFWPWTLRSTSSPRLTRLKLAQL